MADNKTTADLIAWLRMPREGENAYLTEWRNEIADRFEAAHRRECNRNCDRFASAEEAWDAYDEWVESYRAKGETEPFNEFGWLFAPATEKEGGAK